MSISLEAHLEAHSESHYLSLAFLNIGERGIQLVARMLKDNISLNQLDLRGMQIIFHVWNNFDDLFILRTQLCRFYTI